MMTALLIAIALVLGASIVNLLRHINRKLHHMSNASQRMADSVHHMEAVADGAISLIRQIAQNIRDNAGDTDALNAFAAELDNKAGQLADAVTANTPVASPTPLPDNGGEVPAPAETPAEPAPAEGDAPTE